MDVGVDLEQTVSDWGIEDDYGFPIEHPRALNNEVLRDFIRKHFNVNEGAAFWEKFKYTLIVSNLLDDSMVLSKNEQLLQYQEAEPLEDVQSLEVPFRNSDIQLIRQKCHYKMVYRAYPLRLIPHIISLILYFIKSQEIYSRDEMFKFSIILLRLASRMFKVRRTSTIVLTSSILRATTRHLVLNYKINKRMIMSLINLKNYKILNNEDPDNITRLYKGLNHTLDFLIVHLQSFITRLLPYINGEILERFCEVYGLNLELVSEEDFSEPVGIKNQKGKEDRMDLIISKLNKFTQLRKLIICELLTFNEVPRSNFFIIKLKNIFNIQYNEQRYLTDWERWMLIQEFLSSSDKVFSSFNVLFDNLDRYNKLTRAKLDSMNYQDVLTMNDSNNGKSNCRSINFNGLICRLSSLSMNLKFFNKYIQSSNDDFSDLAEQISIFKQFGNELDKIRELYHLTLNDFSNDVQKCDSLFSFNESESQSSFNDLQLKSFHNTSSRRRDQPVISQSPAFSTETQNRKSHRSSGGLQLGLLTVLEEPSDKESIILNTRHESRPRNYYNRDAFEQLSSSKTMTNRSSLFTNNRYSLNSTSSNISGMTEMASLTNLESDEEQPPETLFRQDFKSRLEGNLNRYYVQKSSTNVPNDTDDIENIPHTDTKVNETFTRNLENTLFNINQ